MSGQMIRPPLSGPSAERKKIRMAEQDGSGTRKKITLPRTEAPLVKVCGLTQVDNALACESAGADLIGLVFFPKSPRHLRIPQAKAITAALTVPACGVFVNESYDTIMKTAEACDLKAAQLHGQEPPDLAHSLSAQGLLVIKAFFAARKPDLAQVKAYPRLDFFLAEYGKGILPGGNAEVWDYSLVSGSSDLPPLMLAGGLSPANVRQAVAQASPRAVDASSSLEAAPGIKDLEKVRAFIAAAKQLS